MRDLRKPGGLDIDALYVRHRDALLTWFVRRTADTQTALDLWAETFAQATAGRRRFRGSSDEEAAAWLYAIAKRQLALYHRRGSAEQRALGRLGLERPEAGEELIAEIEQRAGLDELRREVAVAIATLSEPVRAAVELRVVNELDYPTVAGTLGISEPAARARVSRGLLALAAAMNPPPMEEAPAP
jgi:RNA polymerase sigma factor (sigma-70 family)